MMGMHAQNKDNRLNANDAIRVDDKLAAVQQRLEALLDHSPLAVIELDPDGRIARWSAGAARLFGWSADETLGRRIFELGLVHAEDAAALRRMLAGPDPGAPATLRTGRKDGAVLHCEWYGSAVCDAEGRLTAILTQVLDITAHQRTETALAERSERYELIAAGTCDAFWDWDVVNHRVHFSPRWKALRGLAPDEVGEAEWTSRIHPEDAARVMAAVQAHFAGESEVFAEEYRVRRKDGSWMWVLDRGIAHRDASGRVVRMAGSESDITGRRRTEQALRESEERFRRIFEHAAIGIAISDLDGRFQQCNPAFCDLLGYTEEELRALDFASLIHPEDRLANLAEVRRLRAGEASSFQIENRYVRKDGQPVWVNKLVSTLPAASGKPNQWLALVTDVTRRHNAEAALRASEERLRLALHAAQAGAWEWDIVSGAVVWSAENYALYGRDPADGPLTFADWESRVHPADREAVKAAVQDVISGCLPEYRVEFRVIPTPDTERWLLGLGRVESAQDGTPLRMSGIHLDITERRRATEELAQARRLADQRTAELEAVLEAVPAAVWIAHDTDCRRIDGNRTGNEWLGLPRGAETSLTASGGKRPTHFKICQNGRELRGEELPVQRAARGIEVRDFEEEVVLADGSARTLLGNATPLWDAQGRPRGSVAAFVDISERKRMEESLREQVALNRRYLDTVQNLFVALDAEGRITLVNRKGGEVLGYAEDELLGQNWFETCLPQPEGMERVFPVFRGIMAGELEAVEYFENPIRCRDGSRRLIAWHNASLIDRDGAIIGALSSGEDITERRRAEEALRASEAGFRQMADVMPQLVWTAGPDGRVDYYNRRAAQYDGLTQGPDGDWTWRPVLHPDDVERTVAAWQAAVVGGDPYDCEHRMRMADGSVRWHLSRAVPVRDDGGQVVKWFGTATDIQDVKLAQEALQEADRRKDEFLATLAHELRNPLAPIRNAAEVLRLKGPPDPALRAAQDMIDRQLRHMVRLIEDLLDVSRITRGSLRLRRERVELTALLEQVFASFRPQAEQAGQSVTLELPPGPIWLDADPVRLTQVLHNLLDNACKYTGEGGSIGLSAQRDGADVVVRVIDSGIGIDPVLLPRMFEMFSQLDAGSERSRGGLGIGLALARGLVEMHGGRIEASSEGPDKGSQLSVRLPTLEASAVAPTLSADVEESIRPAQAVRILVVDDNADIVDSLGMLLELQGYAVAKARDGLEAVAAAGRFGPHLVLLDIGMPRLDGYGACRRIREQPWGKQMRIVALTGWGQDDTRRKCDEAGFDRHLVKPVEPAALRRLLAELVPAFDEDSESA